MVHAWILTSMLNERCTLNWDANLRTYIIEFGLEWKPSRYVVYSQDLIK